MTRTKSSKPKPKRKSYMLPGTPVYTGTLDITTKITAVCYNADGCTVENLQQFDGFKPDSCKGKHWLHICGLNQAQQIAELGKSLRLHPLLIEDILNTNKQPKIEEFDNCVLVILKYFDPTDNMNPTCEQVSLVLAADFVLSFQESDQPVYAEISQALKDNTGKIRNKGADYLFALLLDRIVDSYLPEIEETEDLLEEMESKILDNDKSVNIREMLLNNRARYQVLKKTVLPLKEAFPRLMRLDNQLIEKTTTTYLRDVFDHLDYVSRSIDSYHEMQLGLMNLYTSNNDLQMNRIMQRLTVVSTVFIPLTFLAGVWGMNFKMMPELYWKYGYLAAWTVLLVTGISIWVYLKKKMY